MPNLLKNIGKTTKKGWSTILSNKQNLLPLCSSTNENIKTHAEVTFLFRINMRTRRNCICKRFRKQEQMIRQSWMKFKVNKPQLFISNWKQGERGGGMFHNGMDQFSRSSSDFGRTSNGVAAKVQFRYPTKKIVISRSSWLQNQIKITNLVISIGRWMPFDSTLQQRYVFFYSPAPDGIRVDGAPVHTPCSGQSRYLPTIVTLLRVHSQ